MTDAPRRFWIGVVSREHIHVGVKGGFIQLGHGKKAPLQRLRASDGLAMYSPRTAYPDGEPLQARVDVTFFDANEAPIKPLIDALSFIKNKTQWGSAFRFGQIKIPAEDFKLIAKAMGVVAKFDGIPVPRRIRQRPDD